MPLVGKFPQHLADLIKTSKYVHVATASKDGIPSVSLMNYIYVPSSKTYISHDQSDDYIIFATLDDTEKYANILANPTVSLLFHDWVTAKNLSLRKHSLSQTPTPDPAQPSTTTGAPQSSKLLNLLQELNQAELFQMSATIRGHGTIIDPKSEESKHYKDLLLRANPDAHVFIQSEKTVIVKVKIESAKVTDNENNTSIYK